MDGNLVILLFMLSGVINVVLFIRAIAKNYVIKNEYYVYYSLCVWIFVVGCIIEVFSREVNLLWTSVVIQYLGYPFIPIFFLLFMRKYINKPIQSKKIIAGLFIIPVVCFVLVFTNQYYKLYFSDFSIVTIGNVSHNEIQGTIFYYITIFYLYVMYGATLISLIKAYMKGSHVLRKKIWFMIFVSASALIASGLFLMDIAPFGADLSPIFMTIINIYIGYDLYVKNPMLHVPYTRTFALEEMQDGYILIDEAGHVLDGNERIYEIFPDLKNREKNFNLFDALHNSEINTLKDSKVEFVEFSLEKDGCKKDYRVNVSKVTDNKGARIFSWLIRDITEENRLMTELEYIIKFDALTGIHNRNAFLEVVNDKFRNYKLNNTNNVNNVNNSNNSRFAILMLDIDYFKQVNDKYGHICGDYVLKTIARELVDNVRKSDCVARYGGEEFVIYIEGVTEEILLSICSKMNKAIEGQTFSFHDATFQVTVSIGGVIYDEKKHQELNDLLEEADEYLYQAKHGGRNRSVVGNTSLSGKVGEQQ